MNSEEIIKFYADFAASYNDRVFQDADYVAFKKIPNWMIDKMEGLSSPLILDLGCGTGLGALEFFKKGMQVTGIDISPEMIEVAKKLPFYQLLCQTLEEQLPFDETTFDGVILLGVMEFIHFPKNLFNEVHRILKKQGLFGLTIPEKMAEDKEKKLEIFTYAEKDIERLFQECGFFIEHREKFQGFISCEETVQYNGYLLKKNDRFEQQ